MVSDWNGNTKKTYDLIPHMAYFYQFNILLFWNHQEYSLKTGFACLVMIFALVELWRIR